MGMTFWELASQITSGKEHGPAQVCTSKLGLEARMDHYWGCGGVVAGTMSALELRIGPRTKPATDYSVFLNNRKGPTAIILS